MNFDLSKRRLAGTGGVDCETAQRENDLILKREPEELELVSQVAAQTLLCETCGRIFLNLRQNDTV